MFDGITPAPNLLLLRAVVAKRPTEAPTAALTGVTCIAVFVARSARCICAAGAAGPVSTAVDACHHLASALAAESLTLGFNKCRSRSCRQRGGGWHRSDAMSRPAKGSGTPCSSLTALLLATRCSPLADRCLLLADRCLPLTARCSPLAAYHSLRCCCVAWLSATRCLRQALRTKPEVPAHQCTSRCTTAVHGRARACSAVTRPSETSLLDERWLSEEPSPARSSEIEVSPCGSAAPARLRRVASANFVR